MAEKLPKAKFKVAQKVFYFADGYVTVDEIKAVSINSFNEIIYFFEIGKVKNIDDKLHFVIDWNNCRNECDVFPTKEALIKSIKDFDFDE